MPPLHAHIINFLDGGNLIAQHKVTKYTEQNDQTLYHVQIAELPIMERPRRTTRRPRSEGPRILQRLFDPDSDHPILRKLIQTIAPIAITFLTQQLPTWLSGIDLENVLQPDDDDQD